MTKKSFSKRAILRKIAVIPFFFVTGLLAIDAQEPVRRVETYLPPPPPPPPPPSRYSRGYVVESNPQGKQYNAGSCKEYVHSNVL